MQYRIVLDVKVDPATTSLTAKEHAEEVCESVRRTVGTGILTAHEPEAEIDSYGIRYKVLRTRTRRKS